jgi:hypothetical protein
MNKFMFIRITLALLVISLSVFAQTKSKKWNDQIAEDGSYKVQMPPSNKALDKQVRKFFAEALPDENLNINNYSAVSSEEIYVIMYADFPAPVLDEMDRDAAYVSLTMKHSIKYGKDSIKKISSSNNERVEMTDTSNKLFDQKIRFLIIKQRIFTLLAIAPSSRKLSSAKNKYYQNRVDKFFNSFVPMEIPAAQYSPTQLPPKDFKLALENNLLTSKLLGLSIKLPEKWTAELHDPNFVMSEKAKQDYDKVNVLQRWLWRNRSKIFSAQPDSLVAKKEKEEWEEVKFSLVIERKDFANTSFDHFAKALSFYGLFAEKKDKKVSKININGRDFISFERINQSEELYLDFTKDVNGTSAKRNWITYEKYYLTEWKGYVLEFTVRYRNEADGKLIDESLKSLEIKE